MIQSSIFPFPEKSTFKDDAKLIGYVQNKVGFNRILSQGQLTLPPNQRLEYMVLFDGLRVASGWKYL